jgi:HEAT repeat protein
MSARAGLVALACVAAPALAARAPDLLELLARARSPETRVAERAREELVRLGPGEAAGILGLCSGRVAELGPLSDAERELLSASVRSWPAERAVEALVAALPEEPSLDDRLAALRLLAEVGGHTTLAAVESLCQGLAPVEDAHPLLEEAVESTLARALRRDPRTYDELRRRCERPLPAALARRVARALGAARLGRGLEVRERLLGRNPELDLHAIRALGELAWFDEPEGRAGAARTLRTYLVSIDADVRRGAALALGALGDGESAGDVLALLEDSDRRVQRAAGMALARLSGLDALATAEAWRRWHEDELAWLEADFDRLVGELEEGDAARCVAALRVLSLHGLHRALVLPEVLPLLEHEEPLVAVAACAALAKLGDPVAFLPLVAALEDERDAVRAAARGALSALTGASPGDDGEAWRAWLVADRAARP